MKVALVYDRINKWGGAESILVALHEIWPEAPLYTSVYDSGLAKWAGVFDLKTSFIQRTPLSKHAHEMYPYLMGIAFESFNFDEYDVVISVTHEFAKAIITKPKTLHLCFCLNPVGYLWDSNRDYFSSKPAWFTALANPLVKYLRWYDKIVAQRPDEYLTISKTVKERIFRIYGRESEIIYPPVNFARVPLAKQEELLKNEGYFLIVSRLVPNKRLDIAIEAFNNLGLPLKIIGIGSEEKRLKSRAKGNIEFLGYLTDEQVARYYDSCRAVVVPGEEDFNIVAVEAQAHGKAVIAYGRGGVTETVIAGKTGWFFQNQSAIDLEKTIRYADFNQIKAADCRKNAEEFSKGRFKSEFRAAVERKFSDYVLSF